MPDFSKSLDDFTQDYGITAGETGGDKDDSSNFVRGFKGSFASLGSASKAAVGAVTGRESFLIAAKHDQEDDGRYYAGDTQDFTDINSAGDLGDWLGYQAGNATASAAQIAVGGGVGGAVVKTAGLKLGETTLKAMGEAALKDLGKKELIGKLDTKIVERLGQAYQKKMAGNLQRSGSAGGMLVSGLPQHVGESAGQMYEETGDAHAGAALVAGTLKASLDMLPIIREFDKFGLAGKAKASITQKVMSSPTRIKRVAKSLSGTMGVEGSTEALQDAIGLVALEVINEEKDHFTAAEFKGLVNSFMAGAAGGATFGLPSALHEAYQSNDPWFKQAAKKREELKDKAKNQAKAGDMQGYDATVGELEQHNETVATEWEDQQANQEREQHLQELAEKQKQRLDQAGISINNDMQDLPNDNQIPFETELPQTLEPPQSDSKPISDNSLGLPLDKQESNNEKSITYDNKDVELPKTKQQLVEGSQQQIDPVPKQRMAASEPDYSTSNAVIEDDFLKQQAEINKGGLDQQANQAAESPSNNLPKPTEKQKEAGNYKKGHIKVHGLDIAIENPKGSERSGKDETGRAWSNTMRSHYGYIKGTVGADKDHLDVFLGDQAENPNADVYVVDQINPSSKRFDEHKIMMGFSDEASARAGYLENYDKGWKGLGAITKMSLADFKAWTKSKNTTKPISWKADSKEIKQKSVARGGNNAPSTTNNLERDSQTADDANGTLQTDVQPKRERDSDSTGQRSRSTGKGRDERTSSDTVPDNKPTTERESSDNGLDKPTGRKRADVTTASPARDTKQQESREDGDSRNPDDGGDGLSRSGSSVQEMDSIATEGKVLDKNLAKPKLNAKINKMIKALDQSIAKDKREMRRLKCT